MKTILAICRWLLIVGLLPAAVLPTSMLRYDPFWKLAYHAEMYRVFGNFGYLNQV